MSRRKNEVNNYHSMVKPGIILVLVILVILTACGIRMISDAKTQVLKSYQSDVDAMCQVYNKQLYAVDAITGLLKHELEECDDLFCNESKRMLETAGSADGIRNIYIVTTDNRALDAYGNEIADIDDNPTLAYVMTAKTETGRFVADESGNQRIYKCKGIFSENTLKGYLVVEYVPEMMEGAIDTPRFTTRRSFALISANGDVVEKVGKKSSLYNVGDNVLDIANKFEFREGSYKSFRQAIVECKSGTQQIKYNGAEANLYYMPIEHCKGIVIMEVDHLDVERSFNSVTKNIRMMLIGIGFSIILFIVISMIVTFYNRTKFSVESEDLQNKADTDQLTDLYNKMATERLIKEYLEGDGKNSSCVLFVIDIDNFKKINDTMGHAFGDSVLSQLGHQIRAWFRVNDIVGRIGGDEFMVFIKNVKNPDIAKKEGQRIMQFFEGFHVGEYTKYSPTASVGGAVYPTDAKDFESLYKAADKAVYKAKRAGKNRVAFYGDANSEENEIEKEEK